MALRTESVGRWSEEKEYVVTAEAIERYADATNDPNPAYRKGPDSVAPPLFSFVPGFQALAGVIEVIPPELMIRIVHLIQDMRNERLIRAGDRLRIRGRVSGIVGGERGTSVVGHAEVRDAEGQLVGEFYATSYIRGHTGEPSVGEPAPDITAERQGEPLATVTQQIDPDQTYRYAEASGDHNPIHLDDEVARSVGLPGIIVHGMCTLAFACRAVVEQVCGGDPSRLKRFAGRFSRPVLPGQQITTTIWAAGERDGRRVYAFETAGPDGPVIRDGLAEVAL